MHVAKTQSLQAIAQIRGRHEGSSRPAVKPAQVTSNDGLQHTYPVMARVSVEVRVKAAEHRDVQTPRGAHRRAAKGSFGGDIDRVGPARNPLAPQRRARGPPHLQPGIARKWDATDQCYRGVTGVTAAFQLVDCLLLRASQRNEVTASSQTFDKVAERMRHTVDFWRICFSDDTDVSLTDAPTVRNGCDVKKTNVLHLR
jgi:hypothetical protein